MSEKCQIKYNFQVTTQLSKYPIQNFKTNISLKHLFLRVDTNQYRN